MRKLVLTTATIALSGSLSIAMAACDFSKPFPLPGVSATAPGTTPNYKGPTPAQLESIVSNSAISKAGKNTPYSTVVPSLCETYASLINNGAIAALAGSNKPQGSQAYQNYLVSNFCQPNVPLSQKDMTGLANAAKALNQIVTGCTSANYANLIYTNSGAKKAASKSFSFGGNSGFPTPPPNPLPTGNNNNEPQSVNQPPPPQQNTPQTNFRSLF